MTIFSDLERTEIEPADHLISQFDYLNASARPEAAQVRTVLEDMVSRYPAPYRTALVRRIRSRNDGLHNGAVFELILHDLLIRQGFQVVEIEPRLPNGRSPDFLVETPNGSRFYLEATLAWGDSGTDPGADRRMRDALEAIDRVQSPNFFLSVHPHGMPRSQVAVGRLRRDVQSFTSGLDYDATLVAFEANLPLPTYNFEHDGLRIRIEVVPKNTRGTGGRAIATRMLPGGLINPHLSIKSAIEGKAGRYGALDLPYVVAVNAFDPFARSESAIEALFGTEAVVTREDGPRFEMIRNPNGVWQGLGGPVYTRVSAVLSTERLSAWDLAQRSMRVILNPWATKPLHDAPFGVDSVNVVNERLVRTPGLTLREILDLPAGWPE